MDNFNGLFNVGWKRFFYGVIWVLIDWFLCYVISTEKNPYPEKIILEDFPATLMISSLCAFYVAICTKQIDWLWKQIKVSRKGKLISIMILVVNIPVILIIYSFLTKGF